MISYMCKKVNGKLTFKRWYRVRSTEKRTRLEIEMKRLRKKWWHFRTRWEIKNK